MSSFDQILTTAESAILELESEIVDLEEKIESHKLRIQNARTQIQALKRFLSPEESGNEGVKSSRAAKKNGKANHELTELQ
jgi:predicted  nucleic acid-binding Zn-ribbon protein